MHNHDIPGPHAPLTGHETIEQVAKALGLDDHIAAMARHYLEHGINCHRCMALIEGDDLNGMFAFQADSPIMDTPSPPTILCQKCGYLTAAFMGIQAAANVCERKGWTP